MAERQLARRMTVTATLTSLSARSLGEIDVPLPPARDLDFVARLVEASESAFAQSIRAARLRREVLRDAMIEKFSHVQATVS